MDERNGNYDELQNAYNATCVKAENLRAKIKRLRTVLDDIYPAIAERAIQLQEAGEERAAAVWRDRARQILNVLSGINT